MPFRRPVGVPVGAPAFQPALRVRRTCEPALAGHRASHHAYRIASPWPGRSAVRAARRFRGRPALE